jgi:hypothetical protein
MKAEHQHPIKAGHEKKTGDIVAFARAFGDRRWECSAYGSRGIQFSDAETDRLDKPRPCVHISSETKTASLVWSFEIWTTELKFRYGSTRATPT